MLAFSAELEKDIRGMYDLLRVNVYKDEEYYWIAVIWFSDEGVIKIERYNYHFPLEDLLKIIKKIEPIATKFLSELKQELLNELPRQFSEALSELKLPELNNDEDEIPF